MIFYGDELINNDNSNKFIVYGRYDIEDKDLIFYYTASGFRCSLKGKIEITIEASLFDDEIKRPYITFYIDKTPIRLGLFQKNNTFSFDVLKHFELFKSTEGSQSIIKIKKITIDGELLKPIIKKKKALVLGDSYTCGFGSLSNNDQDQFTTLEEDGMSTYAFMSLYELDYDMEMVAISGHGIYKSPYAEKTIPDYFFQIDQNNFKKVELKNDIDLIIINLGVNDSIYFQIDKLDEIPNFINTYNDFLQTLRKIYPNAKILMIGITLEHEVLKAIKKVYEETLLKDVYYLELLAHDANFEGLGSLGHPKKITHERWAKEVKKIIKEKIYDC